MNIFREILGHALDNVPAQKMQQPVTDGSAENELVSAEGGGDVHDGVGDGIAYSVTGKDRVPVCHALNLGEDCAGFLVVGPAAFVIQFAKDRHGADE